MTSPAGLADIQCTYSTTGTAVATVRLYDASSALLQTVSAEVEVISSRTAGTAARSALTGLLARLKDGNAALALKSNPGLPVAADKFGSIVRTNFSAYTGDIVVVRGGAMKV